MGKKLSTRNDVEVYLNMLPQLNDEIKDFIKKWEMFYFGWISPFKILDVSKEDFIFFEKRLPQYDCTLREKILILNIGNTNEAALYLHTELDFELYEKYVLKKVDPE